MPRVVFQNTFWNSNLTSNAVLLTFFRNTTFKFENSEKSKILFTLLPFSHINFAECSEDLFFNSSVAEPEPERSEPEPFLSEE